MRTGSCLLLLFTATSVTQAQPTKDKVKHAGKEQDVTVKVGVAPFLFLES